MPRLPRTLERLAVGLAKLAGSAIWRSAMYRTTTYVAVAAAVFLSADIATVQAEEAQQGSEVGCEVPTFFVRDVTALNPNTATCLVCRYGTRPVVMVCSRQMDRQTRQLVEAIDRVVDGHRADGLRGFGMFLAEKPGEVQPQLMSLSRRHGVTIPLTIPIEHTTGPRALNLPQDAATTVIFYSHRKVVARFLFQQGDLTAPQIEHLGEVAKVLARGSREFPTQPAVASK